ncbi:MAG: DEAD/DEAH box helicase [Planctomycetota bacterium]
MKPALRIEPSDLQRRLLRFLERESATELRAHDEMRALPIDERVVSGECIDSATVIEVSKEAVVLRVNDNPSRFREGDSVCLGDGTRFDEALSLVYRSFDPERAELVLARDAYAKFDDHDLRIGQACVVDRRPFTAGSLLAPVVAQAFEDPLLREILTGAREHARDDARYARALLQMRELGLDESQALGAAEAIAARDLALIQGPPGTGKTRMLATMLCALAQKGCRVVVSAFTHRAIDNVLLAVRQRDRTASVVKLASSRDSGAAELRAMGVRVVNPRQLELSRPGEIVGGTAFAVRRLGNRPAFHFAVFDEAGQMPIPHALAGMLLARHFVFVGDHRQLPPVVTSPDRDEIAAVSIFEHLERSYGAHMLETSYRMNAGICSVIGDTFYGGRLRPAAAAASRRMPFVPGGAHDDVLDPDKPVVIARVDHLQPGSRSVEEAHLVADLIDECIRRHGVPAAEIAVLAPFRAHVRALRTAIEKKGIDVTNLVIDTVDRVQGQEREIVFLSLACGDASTLDQRSAFFFSPNRLNVALSRARTKAILVCSSSVATALPMDPAALKAAAIYKTLWRRLPQVDLTAVYGPRRRD